MKTLVKKAGRALAFAMIIASSATLATAQTNVNFNWTVTGSGTETWYSWDMVYQKPSISIYMPTSTTSGCDSRFWTVTAPISGTAYFQYSLSYASYPTGTTGGGSANVYIRDQTARKDIYYDASHGNGGGSFYAIAGHYYVFTVHACGYSSQQYVSVHGFGNSRINIQFPDHYQNTAHTATRTATGGGNNHVGEMTTWKDAGGFYAPPLPQNGGTMSGVGYSLKWDNPKVRLFFSDTHGTNTANPNAHVIAAWVPTIQGLSVEKFSTTNIVFGIPQAFTADYSVGGYCVANGVTNTFGTGPGPAKWGISGLIPNTTYSFQMWASDLVNSFRGPAIITNVTTLPVPVIEGVWVASLTPTNVVFQIPDALTTNYSVGGYYIANGGTNSFGTGPGPSMWGVGPLTPNTDYSFYMWRRDLIHNLSSAMISTNVTTPAMPGYKQITAKEMGTGGVRLSFVGDAGKRYALERSFSLAPANWLPVATNTADDLGSVVFTNVPNAATNNFWRVRTLP